MTYIAFRAEHDPYSLPERRGLFPRRPDDDPAGAPLARDRPAGDEHVSECRSTARGHVQTSGVVTLNLTLSDSGETVQLINQVQLDNSQ